MSHAFIENMLRFRTRQMWQVQESEVALQSATAARGVEEWVINTALFLNQAGHVHFHVAKIQ